MIVSSVSRMRGLVPFSLMVFASACTPTAADGQAGSTDTGADDRLDAVWAAMVEDAEDAVDHDDVEGVAMAVLLGGELAYVTALGEAKPGSAEPMTVDTVLRWNSVSKMHVAMAVMVLVEQGTVDVHAPITTWIPDLTFAGADDPDLLTLHGAMTHTTSLPDHWDTSCDQTARDRWDLPVEPLLAEPGTLYNYSNSGWSLVGEVARLAYGDSFKNTMRDLVLDPAGMSTATFDVHQVVESPHTIGEDGGSLYTPDLHDCPWLRPAGWLHGSILDLAASVEHQLAGGGSVIDSASVDAMRESHHPTHNALGSFAGYGLFSWDHAGTRFVGHGGAGAGHRSYVLMVPDRDFAVVIAANQRDWSPMVLAERAAAAFLDLPVPDPLDFATSPDTWDVYEGTFEDSDDVGTVEVFRDENNGYLYATFADSSDPTSERLYQDGREEFFYIRDGYNYVRFVSGDDGQTRYFANRYFVAERSSVVSAVPSRTPAEVSALLVLGASDGPRDTVHDE